MDGNHLLSEILEQPAILRRIHGRYVERSDEALDAAARLLRRARHVVLAGMVTSEYAGYDTAARLNQHGRMSSVYDVSELLYYHLPMLQRAGTCLVLVSQSGNSAEVVHLIEEIRGRLPIIGVHNDPGSFLAQNCDIALPIYAGPQLACGTKTNLASMAVLGLAAEAALTGATAGAGQGLLDAAATLDRFLSGWEHVATDIADVLEGSPCTVFLGRGSGRTSAMFSATLFREVPKVVAEGMSAASFRHGMWEMLRPEHRVVIFAPAGPAIDRLASLVSDVTRLSVPALVVTNTNVEFESPHVVHVDQVPDPWSPLVDMVPLQLAGYLLARRRGLEPGQLVISSYVTRVE
jgi:glucosamine--fructose-6-phosphate aminotransferase (isomerizing)